MVLDGTFHETNERADFHYLNLKKIKYFCTLENWSTLDGDRAFSHDYDGNTLGNSLVKKSKEFKIFHSNKWNRFWYLLLINLENNTRWAFYKIESEFKNNIVIFTFNIVCELLQMA